MNPNIGTQMKLGLNTLQQLMPGTEAIAFQGMSGLAKDLTALFQSVLDYKESIMGEADVTLKVLAFHEKNVPAQFGKIVRRHTGLVVKSFIDSRTPSMGFACTLRLGEGDLAWVTAAEAIAGYSNSTANIGLDTKITSSDDAIKALDAISKLLNTDTGKLSNTQVTIGNKSTHIVFDIYFCPFTAYLVHQSISTKVDEPTAAEIASIMIHELGHMLSLIEHAGDRIKRMDALQTALHKIISTKGSIEFEIDKASRIGSMVKAGTSGTPEEIARQKAIAESIENTVKVARDSNIVSRSFGVIIQLLVSLLSMGSQMLIGTLVMYPLHILFASTNSDMWKSFESKTGDFMKTFGDDSICERYADEFVSRHGLATAMISGLSKLDSYDAAFSTNMSWAAHRESTLVYNIAKFELFMSLLMSIEDGSGWGTYEPRRQRADRMLQNALKVFKNKDMHPDLLDYFIADYEAIRAAADKGRKRGGLSDKLLRMNVVLVQTVSVSNLYKLLTTGNVDKRYQELINAVEAINASELNYQAARLTRLSRRV